MNNTNKAAAVKAVLEGTESAIADYGWDTNEARTQAIRETAGEFGVAPPSWAVPSENGSGDQGLQLPRAFHANPPRARDVPASAGVLPSASEGNQIMRNMKTFKGSLFGAALACLLISGCAGIGDDGCGDWEHYYVPSGSCLFALASGEAKLTDQPADTTCAPPAVTFTELTEYTVAGQAARDVPIYCSVPGGCSVRIVTGAEDAACKDLQR